MGIISAFIGVNIITTKGDFLNLQFDSLLGINLALSSSLIWASFWILNLLDNRENAVKLAGASRMRWYDFGKAIQSCLRPHTTQDTDGLFFHFNSM